MSHARSLDAHREVEAAIARVLDAERAAREAVEHAQLESTALTEAARAAVRTLEERTERRLRKIRAAFATRSDRAVAELDAQTLDPDSVPSLSAADFGAIDDAVASVAARLTTATS